MAPHTSTLRVVLLDDEPFQLKLLTQQFRRLGMHDVKAFLRPADALMHLRSAPQSTDLVCCDLQMPAMDGIEFIRHLGETAYQGGLVLISGEDRGILAAAKRLVIAQGLHWCGSFHKPVSLVQLEQAGQLAVAGPCRLAEHEAAPHTLSGAELAKAIEEQTLHNFYQPKVDMATGRLMGVETLVRWEHPEHGMVFPNEFIGLAESTSLIDRLTELVMFGPRGALQQARDWGLAGLTLQVAVNVSMENLKHPGFADLVLNKAAAVGIDPSLLVIEVTESQMAREFGAALAILTRLRLKRVGASIDDFGTGYSSLSQLNDLPFDELKIDRSFVHGACNDSHVSAILLPTLDMARQLGIKTVAEGVEDAEDWHFLRTHGCTMAQGYFISKAMRPEELPAWAQEWELRCASLGCG